MSITKDVDEVVGAELPKSESAPCSPSCSPLGYPATSMLVFTLDDERRRQAFESLRDSYVTAVKSQDEPARRVAETLMMVLTEPLIDHVEFFGRTYEWEYPCICHECRSCC